MKFGHVAFRYMGTNRQTDIVQWDTQSQYLTPLLWGEIQIHRLVFLPQINLPLTLMGDQIINYLVKLIICKTITWN